MVESEQRCLPPTPNLVMSLGLQAEHNQQADERVGIFKQERIKILFPWLPVFLLLPTGAPPCEALHNFVELEFVLVKDTALFPPRKSVFHPSKVPLGKANITDLSSVLTKSKNCHRITRLDETFKIKSKPCPNTSSKPWH